MARPDHILDGITVKIREKIGAIAAVERNAMRPTRAGAALVSISFAGDSPNFTNLAFIDWEMRVVTEISLFDKLDKMDSQFMNLRAGIHEALMTDQTLGLSYVQSITPDDVGEPEINDDGDRFAVSVEVTWLVKYRTAKNSIEA
ncbi:hypothetical protein H1X87_11800 [Vibrio parahaemolyticus]|uniref:hypothetical protein n=1 Tax=Vibrio parahaemolyticus TaxID=670 RepID=UPI0016553793|nr:hypothetical protein [Vibrio parahaemolyticus]MBC8662058.1 hypothetical protein [Vibrio parahaemolyticus]